MSEIQDIARAIAKFSAIEEANDLPPHKQTPAREKLLDDASLRRMELEDEIVCLEVKSIGDALSLLMTLKCRLESEVEGENALAVEALVASLIRGMIKLGGTSPLTKCYGGVPVTNFSVETAAHA